MAPVVGGGGFCPVHVRINFYIFRRLLEGENPMISPQLVYLVGNQTLYDKNGLMYGWRGEDPRFRNLDCNWGTCWVDLSFTGRDFEIADPYPGGVSVAFEWGIGC